MATKNENAASEAVTYYICLDGKMYQAEADKCDVKDAINLKKEGCITLNGCEINYCVSNIVVMKCPPGATPPIPVDPSDIPLEAPAKEEA